MKREIHIFDAFDRRIDDSEKSYGIGCERRAYVLIGDKGAVTFVIGTGKYLPHLSQHNKEPMACGLDRHSLVPAPYENPAAPSQNPCRWLGKPCWSDGSCLQADEILKKWLELSQDEDWLWSQLVDYYEREFEVKP